MATGSAGAWTYVTSGTQVTWSTVPPGQKMALVHPSERGRYAPIPPCLPASADATAFAGEIAAVNAAIVAGNTEKDFRAAFALMGSTGLSWKVSDLTANASLTAAKAWRAIWMPGYAEYLDTTGGAW